jgi:hypothetical protein
MSFLNKILGNSSGNVAEVNSSHELKVVTNETRSNMTTFYENDSGIKLVTRYLKSPEVSQDFRLRVGQDTVLFGDTFNSTTQNTSNWKHSFTTMTMTQSAGFLNVNAAGTSTVSGNYAYLQTWRYFPLFGTAPLGVETTAQFTDYPTVNEVIQWGLGIATGAAECIDGVWWEMTSTGITGCIRYNSGTTAKQTLIATITDLDLNQNYKFVVVIGERQVDYWIDDVLYGSQDMPAGQGQPFITTALPYFVQKYNSGTVGSTPNTIFKVGDISVTLMDLSTNQTWANQMSQLGLGMQGLNGGTMGNAMVQWANTTLPTAAAATNTTAALGAFVGGIFQMNAPATSTTDVIVSSWQNPIGGVNQTPRTLKLRGMKVDCVNTVAAVATTGTTFAVAVAWGAQQANLAASLAGTETGSFINNTTKIRRIQPLGVISFPVGAAIGAQATGIQFDFEAPLVINPGEYLQVIAKPLLGTATATEVFVWIISPNLYHE